MFKRFISNDTVAVEVKNTTYRNSRIVVLKSERATALPFEVRIDCVRSTIRFKTAAAGLAHALAAVDESRQAMASATISEPAFA